MLLGSYVGGDANVREKDSVVRMRVTKDQHEAIRSAAEKLGLTMSAYMLFKLGLSAGDKLGSALIEKHRKE